MGNTVWVLDENSDEDEWDHSLILVHEKPLDNLANELGITKLSDLYDHSILAEEYGGEVEPNFVDAQALATTIEALLGAIQDGKLNSDAELIEELQDCLKKTLAASSQGLKVRLAIVP